MTNYFQEPFIVYQMSEEEADEWKAIIKAGQEDFRYRIAKFYLKRRKSPEGMLFRSVPIRNFSKDELIKILDISTRYHSELPKKICLDS